MQTTKPDTRPTAELLAEEHACLTLVHHPDPDLVGVRTVLVPGNRERLGRSSRQLLPGALEDPKLSREHVELEAVGDVVHVADLGSRNGTFVNGVRLEAPAELRPGDVLGIGDSLLLVHRGPLAYREPDHPELLGTSHALAQLLEQIDQVASRETTVMVLGETGTGKELVARAIHARSRRSGKLVAVNCGGLSDGVLHSELFGHARGAFSGAHAAHEGLVAAAARGTLFLDEVADASPTLQSSLLRLLESGEYRAVGATQDRRADVRFVAASAPHIEDMLADRSFREDLWARLSRWVIRVPPLRERREDITQLALRFGASCAGRPVRLSRELALALVRHDWPRNVRELLGVVERAAVASGDRAEEIGLPSWLAKELVPLGGDPAPAEPPPPTGGRKRRRKRPRPDREHLVAVLRKQEGSISAAAAELQVDRKTVYRWTEALDIDVEALRTPD